MNENWVLAWFVVAIWCVIVGVVSAFVTLASGLNIEYSVCCYLVSGLFFVYALVCLKKVKSEYAKLERGDDMMRKDWKTGLGFIIGCVLILVSPHSMYVSLVFLHPNAILAGRQRVVSIVSVLPYPVPVLIGLYALFMGVVLVWKCQDAVRNERFK